MPRSVTLGTGTAPRPTGSGEVLAWPYDVVISLDATRGTYFLLLGEGLGHMSGCSWCTLREMADLRWRAHLTICGCAWLAALAREEIRRGSLFTAEEVLERRPGGNPGRQRQRKTA